MQAIATEIIIATQGADIQKLQPQIKPQNDYPVSGKSFAEYLASYSANDSEPARKNSFESPSATNAGQTDKSIENDNANKKSVESSEKTSENAANDEKIKRQSSTNEVKDEDAEKVESENDRKNRNKAEKTESAEEKLSYLRLELIREENLNAQNTAQVVEKENSEIEVLSNNLFEKIAAADDQRRLKTLESAPKLVVENEFDFEIEDVSIEVLALESAQVSSIENPETFLSRMEVQINDIVPDENLEQIKTENSSISDLKKTNSKFTVTDLRTQKPENEIDVSKLDDAEPKLKVNTVIDGSDSATITMDLNQSAQNATQDILSLNNQAASADGSNFQAMLNNQIQANATEFVKASNIILKDNDKGTINLVLHPDDLGDVKFHLSLDGNKITGHIVVNTKEALEVFKDNAETLREAFIKSGFENAGFEISYNSNGNGGNGEFDQQRQNQNNFFAKRQYSAVDEVIASQGISFESDNFGEFNINIVA